MAVPKRKTSRSKRDSRRGHIKLKVPALSQCSNCGTTTQPHRICPECGYYKGTEVMEIESV